MTELPVRDAHPVFSLGGAIPEPIFEGFPVDKYDLEGTILPRILTEVCVRVYGCVYTLFVTSRPSKVVRGSRVRSLLVLCSC